MHKGVNACRKKALLSFVPLAIERAITVPASGAMILYEAGITVSKSKCFPSVDKCNSTPATRNHSALMRADRRFGLADELIRAAGRATTVDRSEIAIDGLRPEDNEIGSGGSLHKGVNAW